MPAATTHIEFARDVYRILPADFKNEITNMPMYYLGSQGPDVFFFSRASVLPGSLKPLGNRMHDIKVWEVIKYFEDYSGEDHDLLSYLYGYLCHYSLDSHTHPLINAYARKVHEETGRHEGEAHVSAEGEIDTWLLHQRGRMIDTYDVWKYMRIDSESVRKLAAMFSGMFREVFGEDISESRLRTTIREIVLWTRVLKPSNATFHVIYKLEDIIGLPHSISGMMLNGKKDLTVLNLEHYPYHSVDDGHIVSESFPELYGKALYNACRIMQANSSEDFILNFGGEPVLPELNS